MRRRDERGAFLPVMAALFTVLLLMAAMAVDLGMQRSTRRDMQALADVVALDLARLLDGRTAADIRSGTGGKTPLDDAKSASINRNKKTILGDDPSACTAGACVRAYLVEVDAQGEYPTAGGVPQEVAATAAPNGVVVVAKTEVGFAFSGLVGVGKGGATRQALGMAYSSACFRLGSYAVGLTPAASALFKDLLTPLLGSSTLNAVGYNGLASANVSLLDLIKAPSIGVGTVNELLSAPSITAGDIFLAAAHVLRSEGRLAEADVLTLASTSAVAPVVLDMGEFFGLDASDPDIVLFTQLNAMDLLVGTAFFANGENLLNLDNLQAALPSIGVTNTALKIMEKAQMQCRPDEARTSQVSLTSGIKAQLSNSPLINTGRTLLRLVNSSTGQPDAEIDLSLNVQIAGARAQLTDVSCNPDVFDFDIWTDLATLGLTGSATVKGSISATVMGITGVDIPVQFGINIAAYTYKPASTTPAHGQLAIPPKSYDDPVSVGSGDLVLPNVGITLAPGTLTVGPVTVNVLGLPVVVPTADLLGLVNPVIDGLLSPTGALVGRVVPTVQPVVDKVNEILVQLNEALGMNLGGADAYALRYAMCDSPRLRG